MIPNCSQRIRYRARCLHGGHDATWVSERELNGAAHADIVRCASCGISQEIGPIVSVLMMRPQGRPRAATQ